MSNIFLQNKSLLKKSAKEIFIKEKPVSDELILNVT